MDTPSAATPRTDLPSALERFDRIADRLRGATAAVFLDYDGVLTPIVAHPDLAVMSVETRMAVTRLASITPVAVISGRDSADVRSKVGVDGAFYAGSHGFDIVDQEGNPIGDPDRFAPYLDPLESASHALEAGIAGFDGAHVERKRFAVAVHFRQADPAAEQEIEAVVRGEANRYPQLRVTGGKKILELRPAVEWDKGRAVRWLLTELELDRPGVVPLYLGDDVTDEDAFREVRDRGIGIVVGIDGPPSLARYRLEDTEAVETFLGRLNRQLTS